MPAIPRSFEDAVCIMQEVIQHEQLILRRQITAGPIVFLHFLQTLLIGRSLITGSRFIVEDVYIGPAAIKLDRLLCRVDVLTAVQAEKIISRHCGLSLHNAALIGAAALKGHADHKVIAFFADRFHVVGAEEAAVGHGHKGVHSKVKQLLKHRGTGDHVGDGAVKDLKIQRAISLLVGYEHDIEQGKIFALLI